MMKQSVVAGLMLLVLAGCQSVHGTQYIPVSRDYSQLKKIKPKTAEQTVLKAHRVGAQHYDPYDYYSSILYLNTAYSLKHKHDTKGAWDYAKLAEDYAESAIREGSGIVDRGEPVLPQDYDACVSEFNRVKARYDKLDQKKAIEVAPVIYAHATAQLSRAEHELNKKRPWRDAAMRLYSAEADIDTILSQDVDHDGVKDMDDGAPTAPEDKDGFQDDDGVPDPDNDHDGILDADDVKPDDAETANRWHDYDGAPDKYPKLETILFASGSATLDADTRGYLRGITTLLQEWPELKLDVKGYTDDTHSQKYNLDLSRRRAEAVQRYLVAHGAPAAQIIVTFYGSSQPTGNNKTQSGRAKNRRVELVFE